MADSSSDKKIKLANTKKRFKELQDLKKKREETNDFKGLSSTGIENGDRNDSNTPSFDEALILFNVSTTTSQNNVNNLQTSVTKDNLNISNSAPSAANYFTDNSQKASNFFDNLFQQNTTSSNLTSPTYFNSSGGNKSEESTTTIGSYLENNRNSDSNTAEPSQARYSLFPNMNDSKSTSESLKLSSSDNVNKNADPIAIGAEAASENYQKNLENVFSSRDTEKLLDYLNPNKNDSLQVNSSDINQEIDNFTNLTKREISNIENLRQFTDQLAQINKSSESYGYASSGSITDLEKRNIELVSYLEKEKINSQQLQTINSQLQSRLLELDGEIKQKENELNLQKSQDIGHLQNELQAHLQTIGLLIAEKTELSSNLNQYEQNFKQKNAECEELQARLKASRSRVVDLERELNALKTDRDKSESIDEQHINSINNLKKEYNVIKEQKDELVQDLLEVREKLKNSSEENIKLQLVNKDLSGKLSLADIKIQQLSSEGSSVVSNKIEELMQSIFSLEHDKSNLNLRLKSVIKEKEESTVQYQQYAQQLNEQMAILSKELIQLQQTKDTLLLQEQNRIKHIAELEKQLQSRKEAPTTSADTENIKDESKLHRLEEELRMSQMALEGLKEHHTVVARNTDVLLEQLAAKADSVAQLQSVVEQLKGNQPDSVKLLQAMESDKVAASKAIQQNKELKEQLKSMQEVFRKMDDDKVELAENYHAQQQTNKELVEKLKKMESSLQSLTDAIDIKDKELSRLMEGNSKEIHVQDLQYHQLEDRLRHYEAKINSAQAVERELLEAKQTIKRLTSELKNMRGKPYVDNKSDHNTNISDEVIEGIKNVAIVDPNDSLKRTEIPDNVRDTNTKLDKEMAVKYLENKVTKTMQEIADLTDEKQRLEHIILQLQSETETIGEYVALYQHQRMVLKQKTLEKEQQFKKLSDDKEQMKMKLDQLNHLIKKLVTKNYISQDFNVKELNDQANTNDVVNNEVKDQKVDDFTEQTINEINLLLSDIKMSDLIQADENFHHCPSCSGQLITI